MYAQTAHTRESSPTNLASLTQPQMTFARRATQNNRRTSSPAGGALEHKRKQRRATCARCICGTHVEYCTADGLGAEREVGATKPKPKANAACPRDVRRRATREGDRGRPSRRWGGITRARGLIGVIEGGEFRSWRAPLGRRASSPRDGTMHKGGYCGGVRCEMCEGREGLDP